MSKTFVSGTAARRQHVKDKKNIFKHYEGHSAEQLTGEKASLRKFAREGKKEGRNYSSGHMQSVNYHIRQKAMDKAKK